MRLKQLLYGDSWEQLKKVGSACEHGFIFCDGLLYHKNKVGLEVILVIPEDSGLHTCSSSSMMTLVVGHLGMYCMVSALSKCCLGEELHADVKQYYE